MNDEFGTFSYGDDGRKGFGEQPKPEKKKWQPEPYREKITSAENYNPMDYSRQDSLVPSERYTQQNRTGTERFAPAGAVGRTAGTTGTERFAPAGAAGTERFAPAGTAGTERYTPAGTTGTERFAPGRAAGTQQYTSSAPTFTSAGPEPDRYPQVRTPKPESPEPPKHEKRKKDSFGKKLLLTAVLGLVFGLVGGGAFLALNASNIFGKAEKEDSGMTKVTVASSEKTTESSGSDVTVKDQETVGDKEASSTTINYDVAEVVKKAQPSIVSITTKTKQQYQYFYQQFEQEAEGAGSGIIIGCDSDEPKLYIATNHHVIEGANEINVGFCDGQVIKAKVKGSDKTNDVAVVEVDMNDIPDSTKEAISYAAIGNSDELQVGEPAIAIGNALGYGQSVTVGYISALDRSITGSEGTFIQTDAAINPGNSGGALINAKGEVIGINSVKYVDSKVEGMGFSIPINRAISIIETIVDGKTSGKVYIGISGANINSEYSQIYGFPQGAYVKQVNSGSPAEEAGIHEGDILVSVNDTDTLTMENLINELQKYPAGTEVSIGLYRANTQGQYEYITLKVITAEE